MYIIGARRAKRTYFQLGVSWPTWEAEPPVVEDDVRLPDQAAGDANGVQAVVVLLAPGQVGVCPHLPVPQVGGQDLVPLILSRGKILSLFII